MGWWCSRLGIGWNSASRAFFAYLKVKVAIGPGKAHMRFVTSSGLGVPAQPYEGLASPLKPASRAFPWLGCSDGRPVARFRATAFPQPERTAWQPAL